MKNAIFRVFLPFALGYCISYFYRVVNAVIAGPLVEEFGLTADDLGLLTGAYFLTFAAAQLPLGILLDRYGSSRTEAVLLVIAAAGAALFATAEGFFDLVLGRALIGLGVSACLMAAFRAYVLWFARERLPLINGCQMAAGGLGAIIGTTPAKVVVDALSWQTVFAGMAGLTLLTALILLLVVPAEPKRRAPEPVRVLLRGLGQVFTSSAFWRVAPVTIASQASFLAIQGLWAGPWMTTVEGLTAEAAADRLFLIASAMIAGFLLLGGLAERLGRLGIATITVAVSAMALFMLAQALVIAGVGAASPVPWLMFGFFGTSGILPYAGLSQRFPVHLAGRVNTSLNVLVFLCAFAAQWGIGGVVELWPILAARADGVTGHHAGFALMLGLQILGLGWFLIFRGEGVPEAPMLRDA